MSHNQSADYLTINREGWDERTGVHIGSVFYDVEGFLKGRTSLKEIELAGLKDVAGKRLLHLQCHFGLDTLSWARMGTEVTGIDLSPAAIDKARELAQQADIEAEFICDDVYSFGEAAKPAFDIVFTSYGVLCWLPDINRWANTIAASLKPGGTFYMAEFHPVLDLLSGDSYFYRAEPYLESEGTYTDGGDSISNRFATWSHPLGNVVNALVAAGIEIDQLNEFPFSPYNCFENMEEREPGRFYMSHNEQDVPLVYSIHGRKSKT